MMVEAYSVSELTQIIRSRIEQEPRLKDVWVQGEISNFTHHRRGHMYFTLKDETSKIRAVMFAGYNRFLTFRPEDGMKVLARGTVSVYERDGQYQLYVTAMQPDGMGSLYLAFEQLKKRLAAEGLFAPERKKPLPSFPRVIGVITSLSGAAIRDIITTIQRRYPVARIIIAPVEVQGERAVPTIVQALEIMNRRQEADVLIVGRGGGSIEELWAFNEEAVVRAIAASKIPVISAVGHETDVTIADFAADVRAATPTAAAELAVPLYSEIVARIDQWHTRLVRAIHRRLAQETERLQRIEQSTSLRRPEMLIGRQEQRLDHLLDRLRFALQARVHRATVSLQQAEHRLSRLHPGVRLSRESERLQLLRYRLERGVQSHLERNQHRLAVHLRQMDALSPLKVMQRGYALVYSETGTLVRSTRQVHLGELLKVRLRDGVLDCQVYSIQEPPSAEMGELDRAGGETESATG
ncbi:MAG: exodeoxyribonuclease VII large subunit [Bacillota bacterium]|nr:exodeoxyribonuclease VII large subunit [Bacillota bacterium]